MGGEGARRERAREGCERARKGCEKIDTFILLVYITLRRSVVPVLPLREDGG